MKSISERLKINNLLLRNLFHDKILNLTFCIIASKVRIDDLATYVNGSLPSGDLSPWFTDDLSQ